MIVFISNFLSPHMKPFCDCIFQSMKGDFCYIETSELTAERKALGYEYAEIPYVKKLVGNLQEQKKIANEAECVIINVLSANIEIVKDRINANKLTFFISERVLKRGLLKLLDPRFWRLVSLSVQSRNKKVYLLCMGGYVAHDFKMMGFQNEKSFKLGYLPDSSKENCQTRPCDTFRIVWVGRMIDWKRPTFAVKVMKVLKNRGINAKLTMIGDGKERCKVEKLIRKYNLENIELLGIQSNEVVREYMANADAFLLTSNRREGWGAVINEALSAGTPVIASNTVGAAPYLIKDGENGYLYQTNDVNKVADILIKVMKTDKEIIRHNAVATMQLWDATIAGERFIHVVDLIGRGKTPFVYESGPMSKG